MKVEDIDWDILFDLCRKTRTKMDIVEIVFIDSVQVYEHLDEHLEWISFRYRSNDNKLGSYILSGWISVKEYSEWETNGYLPNIRERKITDLFQVISQDQNPQTVS